MKEVLIAKLGEVVLKGMNRRKFEDALFRSVKRRLAPLGEFTYSYAQSTLLIEPVETERESGLPDFFGGGEDPIEQADRALDRVFGIASITRAAICEKEWERVLALAEEYLGPRLRAAHTFKVEAKRSDKHFPMASPEICREAGGYLLRKFPHLRVDVREPEVTVRIEIRDRYAAVHAGARPGAGGLPVGTSGKVALLLSGGIDSPVAGYMMAKRGAALVAVHFESFPYTSVQAKEKVLDLAEIVSHWSGDIKTYVVSFTEIQERMRDTVPQELFTIVMRRFMMRISERIARKEGAGALCTGESLGQVASQTLAGLQATDRAVELPVFRPLIGMDKGEIVEIARRVGSFEKSIEPFDDCCAVFSPKHPDTKPKLDRVEAAEAALDIPALVEAAVAGAEVLLVRPDGRRE